MDPDGNNKLNTKLTSTSTAKKLEDLDQALENQENLTEGNPFKIEWSLFWEGILGDHSEVEVAEVEKKKPQESVRVLTRENIQTLIKELSNQRKQLHKQIEKVNKEIELNSTKLESLRLVGSEPEDTINRINELSDKGQELSLELEKLDQKLKWVRAHEKEAATDKDLA